jgi:hypothetical protein
MTIFPTVQFGRDGLDRQPGAYVAFATLAIGSVPNARSQLVVITSANGLDYDVREVRGALPQLASKGIFFRNLGGAHVETKSGRTFYALKYFDTDGTNSRAILVSTDDGWDFQLHAHPLDAPADNRGFAAIVEFGNDLVAFLESGETIVSDDNGETWELGAATGLTVVNGAAANATAIVVVGNAVVSSVDPRTAFTARNGQLSGSTANAVAAISTGFVLVGSNGRIVSGSADGATWTARTSGTTGFLTFVFHVSGRWYAGGATDWLSSTTLTSWSAHSSDYWASGARADIRRVVAGADKTLAFYGNDRLAYSTNGNTWLQQAVPEIAGLTIIGADYRG